MRIVILVFFSTHPSDLIALSPQIKISHHANVLDSEARPGPACWSGRAARKLPRNASHRFASLPRRRSTQSIRCYILERGPDYTNQAAAGRRAGFMINHSRVRRTSRWPRRHHTPARVRLRRRRRRRRQPIRSDSSGRQRQRRARPQRFAFTACAASPPTAPEAPRGDMTPAHATSPASMR